PRPFASARPATVLVSSLSFIEAVPSRRGRHFSRATASKNRPLAARHREMVCHSLQQTACCPGWNRPCLKPPRPALALRIDREICGARRRKGPTSFEARDTRRTAFVEKPIGCLHP